MRVNKIWYNWGIFEREDLPPPLPSFTVNVSKWEKKTKGAFHLGKKPGNFGGSKSGISDW